MRSITIENAKVISLAKRYGCAFDMNTMSRMVRGEVIELKTFNEPTWIMFDNKAQTFRWLSA